MTLERRIGRIFLPDEEAWKRHANPWSVWSRNTALPFLVLACWSRVWLGWNSLFLIIPAIAWIFLNPRIFSPPTSMHSWASQGVLGERIWMNRDRVLVPPRHRKIPHLLNFLAGSGFLIVIWGTYALNLWALGYGFALVYLGKLWYLDRMVWLYQDMQDLPGNQIPPK